MLLDLPVLSPAEAEASASETTRTWRSLEDYNQTPAFRAQQAQEFAPDALEAPTASSRRDFIKLMGASMAMAGLTACRRPVEQILPYSRKPEEVIPGLPLFYATAMPMAGVLHPMLVESHEGRPTKVEGNTEHPVSQGASNIFQQASILNLYDPDRSKRVLHGNTAASWDDFTDFARTHQPSGQVAVLAEASSSPTMAALRTQLATRYPNLNWVTWEATGDDNAALGTQMAFGQPYRTVHQFDQAQVILSLDADFLGPLNPNNTHDARTYADGRRVMSTSDTMSRLYVVESAFSGTGGMADHRLRLKPSQIGAFAAALAARLGLSEAASAGSAFADHPWIAALADDLRAHQGQGIVLSGSGQPAAVHALCAAINQTLGNIGTTVQLLNTGEAQRQPQDEALAALAQSMSAGQVDTLLMIGVNPVYNAPAGLNFAQALGQVPNTIHLGLWVDETAQASAWHLPQAHYLEAWSDGRAFDGTRSVVQPLVAPLYPDAHSALDVVNALAGGTDSSFELIRNGWRGVLTGDYEAAWRKVVHDGFLADSAFAAASPGAASIGAAVAALPTTADGIELSFRADGKLYDGRFSNNAWMQETPDAVTKITWDNAAMMSPATASALGVGYEIDAGKHYVDTVTISANGQSVELPVWVAPGHADDVVTLNLGYGRAINSTRVPPDVPIYDIDADIYSAGPLANGVGQNVAPLRSAGASFVSGAQVSRAGGGYMVATTQDHGSMEGRPIFRMATLEEYKATPTFAGDVIKRLESEGQQLEPWDEYPALWEDDHPTKDPRYADARYADQQWGMVIDLNTCTGCNACVAACQSENNIQVVGKDQISRGRDMSWIRLDRYYTGDDTHVPGMVTMPVMCMHCENAPCESVCPVAATVHSPDGINVMAYNRCIGTRYCANNCPYKVRRFNFYNWTKTLPDTVHMVQNPNVTVRFRGVMEKCSFCIHRIRKTGQDARREGRGIAEGEVLTACQQACPSQSITFGDLTDANSQVVRMKQNERNYELLEELSVKPRVSYLARLRNPNPSLENVS